MWLLRLGLAPASTLRGFRAWVVTECPVAPGRRGPRLAPATATSLPRKAIAGRRRAARGTGGMTKTTRFLDLVAERHGPLAVIPVTEVSKISAELAPRVGLHPGSARTALRRAVLAAQNGDPR